MFCRHFQKYFWMECLVFGFWFHWNWYPIHYNSALVQVVAGCQTAASNHLDLRWPSCLMPCGITHDDVIKWKYFPYYWPFERGIHRSPVNSPHKGQWRRALMFPFICICNLSASPFYVAYGIRLILDLRPANERCYFVTMSLIGWVQAL